MLIKSDFFPGIVTEFYWNISDLIHHNQTNPATYFLLTFLVLYLINAWRITFETISFYVTGELHHASQWLISLTGKYPNSNSVAQEESDL